MSPRPALHTRRLRLDRLVPPDDQALFAPRSHPHVRRFQGWSPASLDEARAFIARDATVAFGTVGTWTQWAIRDREDGVLIGDAGVCVGDAGRQAEVGCSIDPALHGRGLGTEALTVVLDHLLREMGLHRVHASVDPRNQAALALLERLGFRREALHRKSLWWRGAWVDDVVLALLAEEWL